MYFEYESVGVLLLTPIMLGMECWKWGSLPFLFPSLMLEVVGWLVDKVH